MNIIEYHAFLAEAVSQVRKTKKGCLSPGAAYVFPLVVKELYDVTNFIHHGLTPLLSDIMESRTRLDILLSLSLPDSMFLQRWYNEQTDSILHELAYLDSRIDMMMEMEADAL